MSNNFETEEPEYIEESNDIILLKQYYTPKSLGVQKGHWSMAFTLLTNTIYLMYGHTHFSELVEKSLNYNESITFSNNMKKVIKVNEWTKSSASTAFNSLKKILLKTNINQGFVNKINISYEKAVKRNSLEFCLPTRFKKMPDDNSDKKILLEIIYSVKTITKYKSQTTIRIIIAYIIKLLTNLGIDIQNHMDIKNVSFDELIGCMENTNPTLSMKIKINYIISYLCLVLDDKTHLKNFELHKKKVNPIKKTKDDHDKHRISKGELEKMYDVSDYNIRDKSIFLLMISTGIRACGVSNIRLRNICTIVNNVVTVNKSGRTIEKGNKWFTFPICEKLALLLRDYINNNRKSRTSFLFPGSGEDIGLSTARINAIIKNIAKKAGIEGPHIHAHSLRHSFAHILLESGNKPELVSKMLGHVSVQTTEQYYLKETAVEASKRCNIPWLEKQEQKNPVPDFLSDKTKEIKKKKMSKSSRNLTLYKLKKEFKKVGLKKIVE